MPGPESYNFPVLQGKATDANIETPRSAEIGETSRYDVNYYVPIGGLSAEEIQQTRATNQGFGMELATAGANLIPNIALSMIETGAQLADIEDWSNMIQGNAANYGNVITEWANRNKNQFGEIYRKSSDAGFDITDSAWWVSNGAGLVESVAAYGLTGYGVGTLFGKAATATAKSLNAFGKAKMGIELSAQLGTSGVLAFTEGAMTGGQVYKDVYADSFNSKLAELLQKGAEQYGEDNLTKEYKKYATTYADQFAKQVAGEAATTAVRINMANTLLNLPETGALFRSMSTNRYLDDVLIRSKGENINNYVERIKAFDVNKHLTKKGIQNWTKQTGGEMLEEMVNVYAEQQGKNVGREATGKDIMTLGDMLADDDIWAAGFWGAVGGSMQGFVMNKMPKWVTQEDGTKKRTTVGAYTKDQLKNKYEEQLTDLKDRLIGFVDARDAMVKASKAGDEKAYKEAADKVFSYNSFNSIIKGTEEQLLNDFQNILGLTEEQAAQQGFASDYKERAAEKIQSIRENTKEWNKIQDRYASQDLDQAGFPETIFQQHVNVQNNRKIIQENTLELAKLESEIAQANNLRGTDVTRTSFNDVISSIKAVENSFELATIDLENILNLDKENFFDNKTKQRIIAKISNMYGNIANARTQIEEHLNELKEKRADLINGLEIQKANYYSFIDPDNEMSDAEKETRYASTIAQNTADIDALADGKQVLESNKKILASQEDELRVLKSKEGLERFKQLKKEKMAEREAIDAKAAAKAEAEAAAKAEAAKVEAIKTKKKEAPETVTVEEEEFVEAVTPVESFEEGSYTGEGSKPEEFKKAFKDISKVANNSDVEGEIIDSSGKVISVGDRLIEGSNKLAYASTVEYVEEDGEIKHVSLKLNPETNPDLLTDKYAPGTKLKIRRLTAGEFKPFVTAKDLNFIDELGRKILVANKGETVTFEMLSHPYMQPIGIFNEAGEYQAMLHAANYITSDRIVPANVAADLQALINIRAAVTDKFQDITINSKSNGKLNQLPNFHRLSELIDQPVEFAIATSTIQLNSSKTTPVENLANKKGFKVGQVYAITVMPDGRKLAIPVKTTKVKESPEVLSELMAALDTFLKGGSRGDLQNVFGKYLHSVFSSDKLTKSDNAFDEDPNGKDRIYIDFTSSNVDGIIFGRAGFSKKFISGNSPVDSIEALKKELGSLIQESYVNINFEALKDPDFVKYFVKSNVRFYPLPNGKVTVFDNPVIGFDTSTLLNATAPAAKVTAEPTPIVTPTPTTPVSDIEAKKTDIERRRQEELEAIKLNNSLSEFELENTSDLKTGSTSKRFKIKKDGKEVGIVSLNIDENGNVRIAYMEINFSNRRKGLAENFYKDLNKALQKNKQGVLYSDKVFLDELSEWERMKKRGELRKWILDGKELSKDEIDALKKDINKVIELQDSGRLITEEAEDLQEVLPAQKMWEKLVKKGFAEKLEDGTYRFKYDAELDALEAKPAVTPTPQVQTIEDIKNDIAVLRAKEQAEYDAMADPNDTVEKERIYGVYDKLITPLIEKAEADIERRKKEELNKYPELYKKASTKEELQKIVKEWLDSDILSTSGATPNVLGALSTPGGFERGKELFLEDNVGLINFVSKQINAKYDAELEAVKQVKPAITPASDEKTNIEKEIKDALKNLVLPSGIKPYENTNIQYELEVSQESKNVAKLLSEGKPLTFEFLKDNLGAIFTTNGNNVVTVSINKGTGSIELSEENTVRTIIVSKDDKVDYDFENKGKELNIKNARAISQAEAKYQKYVKDIIDKYNEVQPTAQPTTTAETPTVEIQPTETINLTSASGIEFEVGLDADDDYSITTAEDLGIKPGVQELFDSNPELASIGTQELYSQYLDTIFPDSQVKDIVYHGSPNADKIKKEGFKNKQERDKGYIGDGYYFTKDFSWQSYTGDISGVSKDISKRVSVILNSSNPQLINTEEDRKNLLNKPNVDSRILLFDYNLDLTIEDAIKQGEVRFNLPINELIEVVVFEPEQIHILGSKQDIDGFKEFAKSGKQIEKSVSLQDKVNILIQEGKATKFCK